MKPYIETLNKVMGGSRDALKQMWKFQKKSWAKLKRDSRRKKRRQDKQDILTE